MTASDKDHRSQSQKPSGNQRPRDAATLVIVDNAMREPRVLMGRRRANQIFLPNKFVFPGGRVERHDRNAVSADQLHPLELAKLRVDMKGAVSDTRARGLALAAIRETFEEAGILIGVKDASGRQPHETWVAFQECGVTPAIRDLSFFARAITPPGRPRRYDTRFFCVEASAIAARTEPRDDELSGLDWFTFDDMRSLDLPNITRAVIEDLSDRLKIGIAAGNAPVPYYHFKNGAFRREMIEAPTP